MSDNKMSGDQKQIVAVTFVVVAGVLGAILSVQGCYNRQDARIQKMVEGGATPIEAVCAVAPSTVTPSVCVSALVERAARQREEPSK